MSRSKRLQIVLDLALRKVQEGAAAFAFIQHKLHGEQEKLVQLQEYLLEYRQALQIQGKQGVSVQHFRIHNSFSANVEQAITQQTQQIIVLRRQVEQVRARWQALDARHKGLLKLQDRIMREERAVAERQEQKELDELTARLRPLHIRR